MATISDVSQATFDSEVLQSADPVLVDFWAPWCGPCRMLAPVVERVSQKFAGKAKFLKLNTDENPSVAGKYGVSGIPCLILFKGGSVADRIVGYVPEEKISTMLNKHVAAA